MPMIDHWSDRAIPLTQVSFKPGVFCQELVFNMFGVISSPLMVYLVGCNGMIHR